MKRQAFHENWVFKKQGHETGRRITLPHDAMLEEKRCPDSPGGSASGWFPGGIYEYEKQIDIPQEWEQKHILLQFEGVYKNSKVYLNEVEAGGAAYGYIPFFVCLDGMVKYGERNTIRVVADNSDQPNSRWYSGAGIYRPVWLWEGENIHIKPEGVQVTTISYQPARVRVEAKVTGAVESVKMEIRDGGQVILDAVLTPYAVNGMEQEIQETVWAGEYEIEDAKLWSADSPNLYDCHVNVMVKDRVADETEVIFGIRKMEWSANGLFINGKQTLLRGGCVHHDNGILGAASYRESEFRRVKMLKNAGYNAIRASHNPAAEAMLAACDVYGMYVIDETWDMWYHKKNTFDYAKDFQENYKKDIRAMIARDYNHPSVIMYSIGNEVSEPAQKKGVQLAEEMVEYCHQLDISRPVTAGINLMIISSSAKGKGIYDEKIGGRDDSKEKKMQGMNSTVFNMVTSMIGTGMNKAANSKKADVATTPVLDVLDIAGYNYASGRYSMEGKAHPKRVIFGSETFPQDIAKNWEQVKKYPYLIGDFMWTAWDYLGEAGIGAWGYTPDAKGFDKPYPWILGDVGAMDILGNPNGELFWAQVVWRIKDVPKIAVQPVNHLGVKPIKGAWRGTNAIPSWSWSGCEGKKAVVEVYTSGERVELHLNGKQVGKAKVKQNRAVLKVPYIPGELRAIAYDTTGRHLGESTLVSATGNHSVQVTMDTWGQKAEDIKPGSIVYYNVEVIGENGIVESNADRTLHVNMEGGELLAFGSACPRTEEVYQSGTFTTYYGKAQAVVRVTDPAKLRLEVQ